MSTNISEQKRECRAEIKRRLSEFTPEQLHASDIAIAERFLALPQVQSLAPTARVFAYASYGTEVSTLKILSHFRKIKQYVYICWDWAVDVLPQAGDIIIVPAVTFDADGYRVGKGGGYYDRLLAVNRGAAVEPFAANSVTDGGAFTVGLMRDALLLPSVPREPHDMCVDAIVTETRVMTICN